MDYDRLPSWMADSPLADDEAPKAKAPSPEPADEAQHTIAPSQKTPSTQGSSPLAVPAEPPPSDTVTCSRIL